jgi:hypothetical protein
MVGLETDDEVLAELRRLHNKEFRKEDLCIQRPKSFSDVILVGLFAYDRGCRLGDAFFKGKLVNISENHREIFQSTGWNNNSSENSKILRAWFIEIFCAFRHPVTSRPKDFPEDRWFELTVDHINGNYVVKGWVQEPVGMKPEMVFKVHEIEFDENGNFQSAKVLDQLTINL